VTEPSTYVLEHLRAVIEQPPVAELGIELTVDGGGRVHLAGPVSCDEQRAAVVDAVRHAAPEMDVVDDLTVVHRPPDPTVEEIT
jgi:hypothetical protein